MTARQQDNRPAGRPNRFGPTTEPAQPPGMSSVLARNIEALDERRRREESSATMEDRIAQAITRFTGSMRFVYIHMALFGGWILCNVGLIPGAPRFDPSLVILAMAASVEAIFLSTFVLISQNRISAAADRRAELDLQVSLLAEHEITKLAGLVSALAAHHGLDLGTDPELQEIQRNVAPEAVLDEIEAKSADLRNRPGSTAAGAGASAPATLTSGSIA